ncbi:zinc-dependent peptidase [Limibacter armeniacum]|uniref:zinc-dependent peptidase n=1 Tax=Limibacter armeniacum TaxID=466084 RepID=UPI002FE58D1F
MEKNLLMAAFLVAVLSLAAVAFWWFTRKRSKTEIQENIAEKDFKETWRKLLTQHVSFYNELSAPLKTQFEKRIQYFLAHVRIEGVETEVEDLDRVLVAASGVIPIFGYPEWWYPNLKSVLLYDKTLNHLGLADVEGGYVMGMVGNKALKDKVLFSKGALREGFRNDADKKNVGIHEFVHLIDMADGKADGIPEVLLQKSYTLPWMHLMHEKINDIHQGASDINPYGGSSEVEFLTVASEYFFERPMLLKKKHPKLYAKLEKIFAQQLDMQKKSSRKSKREAIGRNDPCPCGSGKKYKHCCGR